jgi:hypothetical protein
MAGKGCRKTAFVLGIGCLAIPVGLAIVVAIFLYAGQKLYQRNGPSQPEPAALAIPPVAPPGGPSSSGASGNVLPGRDLPPLGGAPGAGAPPLRLTLDLSEGQFDVVPGPPGSDIKVDGLFDPRDYEMTQETESSADAGRSVTIRFRRKIPFLFLFFQGFDKRNPNKVTVSIPEGVPTALSLVLKRCEASVELGGLTLTDLNARLAMGDQKVRFSRPVPGGLAHASVRASMGNIGFTGLGYAAPSDFQFQGSMGDFNLDFTGQWPASFQAKTRIRHSMGDLRIRIPKEVRMSESSRTHVVLGDTRTRGMKEAQTEDPNAPVMELDLSGSMGDTTVIHE